MRTKEIRVTYGFTVNLGDYESARVDAGATVEVGPGDDVNDVYRETFKEAFQQVVSRLDQLTEMAESRNEKRRVRRRKKRE